MPTITRRHLEHATRVIHQGRGYQSTVYLVEVDGLSAAVKDFSTAPLLFRTLVAPYLLRRETRALQHLSGTAGVPAFYGQVDRLAFAMEFIEGTPLATFSRGQVAPETFPRLQAVIDAIHARGVAHGDLKRRTNMLLTPGGAIYLIDFAAATIRGGPLQPFRNWLQAQMAQIDNKSVPRLKRFVAPELLTPEDDQKLNNPTGLEKLARRLLNR